MVTSETAACIPNKDNQESCRKSTIERYSLLSHRTDEYSIFVIPLKKERKVSLSWPSWREIQVSGCQMSREKCRQAEIISNSDTVHATLCSQIAVPVANISQFRDLEHFERLDQYNVLGAPAPKTRVVRGNPLVLRSQDCSSSKIQLEVLELDLEISSLCTGFGCSWTNMHLCVLIKLTPPSNFTNRMLRTIVSNNIHP